MEYIKVQSGIGGQNDNSKSPPQSLALRLAARANGPAFRLWPD